MVLSLQHEIHSFKVQWCKTNRPSVQISSEGPGKCYCNEITMDDRYSCITYDSNGKLWRKRPKIPYKPSQCDRKTKTVASLERCKDAWRHHKILQCYVQGDDVTSLNVTWTKQGPSCDCKRSKRMFKQHVNFMSWTWVCCLNTTSSTFNHSFKQLCS